MNIKNSILKRIKYLKNLWAYYQRSRITKDPNTWCFVSFEKDFTSNLKATFEYVKENHKNINILILSDKASYQKYQSEKINVIKTTQSHLYSSASLIITDQLLAGHPSFKNVHAIDIPILNVWHGIPMKNMGIPHQGFIPYIKGEKENFNLIASSNIDAKSMSKCFDLPLKNISITGLPKIDLLKNQPFSDHEKNKLKDLIKGKKLILFCPTWRDNESDYYNFSNIDLANLKNFLDKNNCILGVRDHLNHQNNSYFQKLKSIGAIDLDRSVFNNIELLLFNAEILITDYSSCHFDFLALHKPTVSFGYDYEYYKSIERGFLYPMSDVFPNPICSTFTDVITQLSIILQNSSSNKDHHTLHNRFYKYDDNKNTSRVVELALSLVNNTK